MEQKILNLFKDFRFLENSKLPILAGKFPDEIIEEIEYFTTVCKSLKRHNLSFLKNHLNVGMNKYQVSVPTNIFEDSFTFAFLNHLGEFYASHFTKLSVEDCKRRVLVRKNQGHYDAYDFWINFIEPGDINALHNHAGTFSGVIYFDNEINMPTIFEDGVSYNGQKGEIILFPSEYLHKVEENKSDKTRISYAFNMEFIGGH